MQPCSRSRWPCMRVVCVSRNNWQNDLGTHLGKYSIRLFTEWISRDWSTVRRVNGSRKNPGSLIGGCKLTVLFICTAVVIGSPAYRATIRFQLIEIISDEWPMLSPVYDMTQWSHLLWLSVAGQARPLLGRYDDVNYSTTTCPRWCGNVCFPGSLHSKS